MYIVNKNKKYFIYSVPSGRYQRFDNYKDFIDRIRLGSYPIGNGTGLKNTFIEEINMNFNDKTFWRDSDGNIFRCIEREYLFYDSDRRTIDLRNLEEDIFKEDLRLLREGLFYYYYRFPKRKKQEYIFRKTPVPKTGVGRGRWYNRCHKCGYIKELRDSEMIDTKYIKVSRINDLLETQKYRRKRVDKTHCWKSQSKKKKQWM